MRKFSPFVIFLFVSLLQGQELEVRGYLITAFEEPLSGCTVFLKGAELKVSSDVQGFFTLPLPPNFSSGFCKYEQRKGLK
jgi:hypothetical protein